MPSWRGGCQVCSIAGDASHTLDSLGDKRRGLYCLLAVATLLNLLTPDLLGGVPEFISTLQTYEGGFGNASFPDWAFSDGMHLTYVQLPIFA